MSINRTFEINDLTPEELARLFTDMVSFGQAKFFAEVWRIASEWPGAGWCQQSYDIAKNAEYCPGASDAVTTLAAHFGMAAEIATLAPVDDVQ
jgi:hypothetical protein